MNNSDRDDPILKRKPYFKVGISYKKDNGTPFILKKNEKKIQRMFRKLGKNIPLTTSTKLDNYSNEVILLIDGKRDIYTIGQKLKDKYGDELEPLYERLVVFLEHIRVEKKWISFKD